MKKQILTMISLLLGAVLWGGSPGYAQPSENPEQAAADTRAAGEGSDSLDKRFDFEERYQKAASLFWRNQTELSKLKQYFVQAEAGKIKFFGLNENKEDVYYTGEKLAPGEYDLVADAARLLFEDKSVAYGGGISFERYQFDPQGVVLYVGLGIPKQIGDFYSHDAITFHKYPGSYEERRSGAVRYFDREIAPQWYFVQTIFKFLGFRCPDGGYVRHISLHNYDIVEEGPSLEKEDFAVLFRKNRAVFGQLLKVLREYGQGEGFVYSRHFSYEAYNEPYEGGITHEIYSKMYFSKAENTSAEEWRNNKIAVYQAAEEFLAELKKRQMLTSSAVTIAYYRDKTAGECLDVYLANRPPIEANMPIFGESIAVKYRSGAVKENERGKLKPIDLNWYYEKFDQNKLDFGGRANGVFR